MNNDEAMFKYLWSSDMCSMLWNMGHYFMLLKAVMKYNWESGVRLLLQSTTTKVIFVSTVTNVDDFIDTVDVLAENIAKFEKMNLPLARKFREGLNKRPYILFSFFLELS